jgi:hyperosmotically inducible periplasmic protein
MGSFIRTVLLLVILLLVGAYLLGYMPQTGSLFGHPSTASVPQAPSAQELKDRAADAARRVDETLSDTGLTTKIKAKIALDDTLKRADVSIHTKDGVVTVSGTVPSAAMQTRVLQLVRETAGVKSVVNTLKIAETA